MSFDIFETTARNTERAIAANNKRLRKMREFNKLKELHGCE